MLLDHDDFARWKKGGRPDLISSAYIKRARDGKVTLRFASDGRVPPSSSGRTTSARFT